MQKQSTKKLLEQEILEQTLIMKEKFPEAYKLLSESPVAFSKLNESREIQDLEAYLETIKSQLSKLTQK